MIKWEIFSVSDQNLLKLYKLFDGAFERALDLYEQGRVTQISTSNAIITELCKGANEASWLMQVKGHSGALYTLFPEVNYCTCAAFRYNCVNKLFTWKSTIIFSKILYVEIRKYLCTCTRYEQLYL